MKNSLALLAAFTCLIFGTLQAQNSLTKSLQPNRSTSASLEVSHPVGVKEITDNKIKILVDVYLEDASTETLESMMQIGHYDVTSAQEGSNFKINMPGLNNQIIMDDKEVTEAISLLVFAPSSVNVTTDAGDNSTLINIKKFDGSALPPLDVVFEFNVPFDSGNTGNATTGTSNPNQQNIETINAELLAKNQEIMAFVKDLGELQEELNRSYKDVMSPADHDKVNNLVLTVEKKNQDLQELLNELTVLQARLDSAYEQGNQ